MATVNRGEFEYQQEGKPNIFDYKPSNSCIQRLKHQISLQPKSIQLLIFGLCICLICSLLVICSTFNVSTEKVTDINDNDIAAVSPSPSSSIKPIVLFIHLHKAGGTKIIQSFQNSNNYNLFEPNANGNPQKFDPQTNRKWDIPFGIYSNEDMNKFRDQLMEQNVTFISMESHFFDAKHNHFEYMQQLKLFDVFTMIRDPFTRIISNYFYDLQGGFYNLTALNQLSNLDDKMIWFCKNTPSVFNHNNYYVRFLNGIQDQNVEINQDHFETAKKILSQFDAIGILEFKSTWIMLEKRYKIKLRDAQSINAHKGDHENPTSRFEKWFRKENKWDFELYDYAVQLSSERNSSV